MTMVHGEDHVKAHAAALRYAGTVRSDGPQEASSVAGAIDAAGRARGSLGVLAEMAEGLLAKVTGPIPPRGNDARGEASTSGPRGVVDQLHHEIRGLTDPMTRIEFALRDIDARIG